MFFLPGRVPGRGAGHRCRLPLQPAPRCSQSHSFCLCPHLRALHSPAASRAATATTAVFPPWRPQHGALSAKVSAGEVRAGGSKGGRQGGTLGGGCWASAGFKLPLGPGSSGVGRVFSSRSLKFPEGCGTRAGHHMNPSL